MEALTKQGDNIAGWENKRDFYKVDIFYEQAEKIRVQAFEKYHAGNVGSMKEAYVMMLRFTKFYELIGSHKAVNKSDKKFKQLQRDFITTLDAAEDLKKRLTKHFGESDPAPPPPSAEPEPPRDELAVDMADLLEKRWANLQPAVRPKPEPPKPLEPTQKPVEPPPAPTGGAAAAAAAAALVGGTAAAAATEALVNGGGGAMDALQARFANLASGGGGGGSGADPSATMAVTNPTPTPPVPPAQPQIPDISDGVISQPPAQPPAQPPTAPPPTPPPDLPNPNPPAPPPGAPAPASSTTNATTTTTATPTPPPGVKPPAAAAPATPKPPLPPPPPGPPPDSNPTIIPPPAYEYANTMYPKVARPVQQLPGGGGGKSGAGGVTRERSGEGGSKASAAAAAAAAGVAERGMRAPSERPADAKSQAEVEALRKRVEARRKSSEPQDPRSRLNRHLRIRGFTIKDVPGDNNCQFHAVADQLNQVGITGWTALKVREKTVQWLKANGERPMDDGKVGQRTLLKDFVGVGNWRSYIAEMSQHGRTWGDEATLLAASVLFRAEICVISSLSEDYCHIVTPPDIWGVELRTRIYLGHYHEFHYVSTRPVG